MIICLVLLRKINFLSTPHKHLHHDSDFVSCVLPEDKQEGKFVSKNVINLLQRQLTTSEISLLSKGLKFVPASKRTDAAKFF